MEDSHVSVRPWHRTRANGSEPYPGGHGSRVERGPHRAARHLLRAADVVEPNEEDRDEGDSRGEELRLHRGPLREPRPPHSLSTRHRPAGDDRVRSPDRDRHVNKETQMFIGS
eukprot:scaffold125650_cov31-Tisochrysis_lutea.AAC.1